IDSTFPKGKAFADWLQAQKVTTTYGQITLSDTRYDMNAVSAGTTRWIYNAAAAGAAQYATMFMSFHAPTTTPPALACGRAMYSDLHLSGTSNDAVFPNECAAADPGGMHHANEQALEFLFFDLSSCVQDEAMPPVPITPK